MIRDRNHSLPDRHTQLNDLHDLGSSGPSIPSGIDDRSNLHPQVAPANPFGPPQPPPKTLKAKNKAAAPTKAGPIKHPPHLPAKRKPQPKHQNVPKTQEKSKNAATITKQTPLPPKPPKPPQPKNKKAGGRHKARARADKLRQQYPGIKGVPATVSKNERAQRIADYIAIHGDPTNKAVQPKTRPKTITKASQRHSKRLAEQSSAAAAATTIAGASRRNPIALD